MSPKASDLGNGVQLRLNGGVLRLQGTATGAQAPAEWRVGQQLQARVLAPAPDGGLRLAVGERVLAAARGPELQPGQALTLKVRSLEPGRPPVLEVAATPGTTRLDRVAALPERQPPVHLARLAASPPAIGWYRGQTVAAQVLPAPAGEGRLAVAGRQLVTDPLPGLSSGQPATVRVRELADGRPTRVEVLPRGPSTGPAAGTPRPAPTVGVRDLRPAPLPAGVAPALEGLGRILPAAGQLVHAAGLQEALARSGLFLEHDLALGRAPEGDLKAQLLRIAQRLRAGTPEPAPAGNAERGTGTPLRLLQELRGSSEAALERLQGQQAQSLGGRESGQWALYADLPFHLGEETRSLGLRLRREGGSEDGDGLWRLSLSVDLPTLGPLTARVTLQGSVLHVHFWSERPAAVRLIDAHIERLQARLAAAGLEPGQLACHQGPPPAWDPPPGDGPRRALLDEKA